MVRIAHCSIGENGIRNNQPGDQTGKECCIREWYKKPWGILLRHPNEQIAYRIASIAERLAKSDLVGYDQNIAPSDGRNTLHTALRSLEYDVDLYLRSEIKTEADCSSFATVCAIAAGVKTLEYTGNAPSTTTMERSFRNAGFNVLTNAKYLDGTKYLKRGDILVKSGSHTVIVLDDGASDKEYYPPYKGKATTLSQALSECGIDSSKSNRKLIYNANFSDTYMFTAGQNNRLLNLLKDGKLAKPN